MQLNTTYLNQTPNKTPRNTTTFKPEFVIMHETAGYGSLQWNLKPSVRSSYNYLISRNGTIYHYVDEKKYIAWHAGVRSEARGYEEGEINIYAIGCELEGPNDGLPITVAQWKSMIELMHHFRDTYGIPIHKDYYLAHKDVAPGYKSDPKGYSVPVAIERANPAPTLPTDLTVLGVRPSCTYTQFEASLERHKAQLSKTEIDRVWQFCYWLEVDPCFIIALWKAESGSPLGNSPLQQQTNCPINIKTFVWPGRDSVTHNGAEWEQWQSQQLGLYRSILHLKQVHGAHGRTTLKQIIPVHAPASDNNNPENIIKSIIEDMTWISTH